MVVLDGVEDRSYQVEAAAVLLDDAEQDYVLNMPVGGGKTETAIEFITAAYDMSQDDSYSALVICPNRRVEDQWFERFEEYGLTEQLDVGRNQTASSSSGSFNDGSVVWKRDDGGRDIRERMDRVESYLQQDFEDRKQSSFTDNTVQLTTYQLLKSDVDRGRIDGETLAQYDDMIIDEATHLVAIDREAFDGDGAWSYRLNEYFDTFLDDIPAADKPRLIGLTGLAGERLDAIQEHIDADLLRPAQETVDEYRPELRRVEPHTAGDSPLFTLLRDLEEQYRKTRYSVKGLLAGEGKNDADVSLFSLQQYADRDDQVGQLARRALQQHTLQSRVQEGTYGSLQPYKGDLINTVGYDDRVSTALQDAFADGAPAGADPEREQRKLEHAPYQATLWADLFPTMKEIGVRNLHEQIYENNDQSLVFTRHVATANDLPAIFPGNNGVITGNTSSDRQREIIDAFNDEELDSLVMTYGVGGEGLDFSTAEHAVLMGEPRTVAEHHNATGRIRRGDGPKWEHALIYYSNDHERRYDRYQDLLDDGAFSEAVMTEPSDTARDAIDNIIAD